MVFGSNPIMRNNRLVPDAIAIMQSANLFIYTVHNPIRWIDPLGLALMAIRYFVERQGEIVEWNDITRLAYFNIGGNSLDSHVSEANLSGINITKVNRRLMANTADLYRHFN